MDRHDAPTALLMGRSLARSTVWGRLPCVTFVEAKEEPDGEGSAVPSARPLLMIDIDGVLSLFGRGPSSATVPPVPGASETSAPEGRFHWIDGIPHFLSATAATHLLALSPLFDLVWASGWEEKAEEYLPHLLGLPGGLPFLRFPADARRDEPPTHTGSSRRSTDMRRAGRSHGSTTRSTARARNGRTRARRRRCSSERRPSTASRRGRSAFCGRGRRSSRCAERDGVCEVHRF